MHSDRILCGPARNALHVIGQFNATLKHRGGVTSEEVYVVRGLQTPLIGLPAIKALGLVVRVCATESGHKDFHLGSLLHQRNSRSECLKFFLVLIVCIMDDNGRCLDFWDKPRNP